MSIKRLILAEAEKLARSAVFWVAPIVLVFFLALLLFGFEVNAAKSGVPSSEAVSLENYKTGSVVASAYSMVQRVGRNVFAFIGLAKPEATTDNFAVENSIKKTYDEILSINDRDFLDKMEQARDGTIPTQEAVKIIRRKLQAKPDSPHAIEVEDAELIRIIEDKNLYEALKEKNRQITPKTLKEFRYFGNFFNSLFSPNPLPRPDCECSKEEKKGEEESPSPLSFLIGKAYAEEKEFPGKLPPTINWEDSFGERLKKRIVWLTDPIELDGMAIDRSRFNGMRFTYTSLYFAAIFAFPLISLAVVVQMFAGEFVHATIRTCFLKSIERSQLLYAKLIVLGIYLFLLVAFFIIMTLVVGITFSGYGNLLIDSELLGTAGEQRVILGDGAMLLFTFCIPVIALSLFPLSSLGILLSYIKPEPSTIIGILSIVYFILFAMGDLPIFRDIRFLFFTSYMDAWPLMFQAPFQLGLFTSKLFVLCLITGGVLLLVNYISNRKDIYV